MSIEIHTLSATVTDGNGVRVSANSAEILGDHYGRKYLTAAAAAAAREAAETAAREYYPTAEIAVATLAEKTLVVGDRYDLSSLNEHYAGDLPEGYHLADYFGPQGEYKGADIHGIEPRLY
jgi:hypothetical protein